MKRLLPDHRAPIDFPGKLQRNFASVQSCGDFVVGEQLSGRVSLSKGDLHLFPDRIEPVTRDRIDDRDKRLASRQARVRLEYEVQRLVMLQKCLLCSR